KAVAGDVVKSGREQNESIRGADEQGCGSASEEELARCEPRRDEDAEVPRAVLEDRDRAERRHADAKQRYPLVEKRAGELRYKTDDEQRPLVDGHEDAERCDDLRETAAMFLRLDSASQYISCEALRNAVARRHRTPKLREMCREWS